MITAPPYCKDFDLYNVLLPEHRWIFNKLEICERFGYAGGPCGLPMPKGTYCIRPIINLNGMGQGGFTKRTVTEDGLMIVKPGHVWTEWNDGPRQWIEYLDDQVSSSQIQVNWDGKKETYKEQPLSQVKPIPEILKGISRYMLVEFLGDEVIDIGPRHMPEEAKWSVVKDYQKFDPSYTMPDHATNGFCPHMERVTHADGTWGWKETDEWVPRRIYT